MKKLGYVVGLLLAFGIGWSVRPVPVKAAGSLVVTQVKIPARQSVNPTLASGDGKGLSCLELKDGEFNCFVLSQ
jgi:hypothetical protein